MSRRGVVDAYVSICANEQARSVRGPIDNLEGSVQIGIARNAAALQRPPMAAGIVALNGNFGVARIPDMQGRRRTRCPDTDAAARVDPQPFAAAGGQSDSIGSGMKQSR